MPYDKDYNNRWRKKNALRLVQKYRKNRNEFITKKGGKCAYCGEKKHLVIDHINPKTKRKQASDCFKLSKKTASKELKKCQVLCFDCHLKKSSKEKFNS